MAKLTKKWLSKGLTYEKMKKMECKHGSFTCGLLQKLKMVNRCRRCNREFHI